MRAARHLGLDVADHEIITTGRGDNVFVSKRFDRVQLDGQLHRLHQEDFAQALAVDPALKYQADGGPGLGDFARLLNAFPSAAGEKARRALFDALVFTVAAVNTDAHAKNYAIVHLGRQMRLAPLYDLGTNVLYGGRETVVSAVTIGGARAMEGIGLKNFLAAAKTLRVDPDYAEASVHRIRGGVADAFATARDETLTDSAGKNYVDKLVDAIVARAQIRGWTS